jgi:hypothetical protein
MTYLKHPSATPKYHASSEEEARAVLETQLFYVINTQGSEVASSVLAECLYKYSRLTEIWIKAVLHAHMETFQEYITSGNLNAAMRYMKEQLTDRGVPHPEHTTLNRLMTELWVRPEVFGFSR